MWLPPKLFHTFPQMFIKKKVIGSNIKTSNFDSPPIRLYQSTTYCNFEQKENLNTHIDFTFHILLTEQGQNQLYRHQI